MQAWACVLADRAHRCPPRRRGRTGATRTAAGAPGGRAQPRPAPRGAPRPAGPGPAGARAGHEGGTRALCTMRASPYTDSGAASRPWQAGPCSGRRAQAAQRRRQAPMRGWCGPASLLPSGTACAENAQKICKGVAAPGLAAHLHYARVRRCVQAGGGGRRGHHGLRCRARPRPCSCTPARRGARRRACCAAIWCARRLGRAPRRGECGRGPWSGPRPGPWAR